MLQGPEDSGNVKLELADLGPTDLLLMGNGWSIPVHRYGTALSLAQSMAGSTTHSSGNCAANESLYLFHMLCSSIFVGRDWPGDQLTAGLAD